MPPTARRPMHINLGLAPNFHIDIWNVRSPVLAHEGSQNFSSTPVDSPKTPELVSLNTSVSDIPPMRQKPRTPARRVRCVSSGGSSCADMDLASQVDDLANSVSTPTSRHTDFSPADPSVGWQTPKSKRNMSPKRPQYPDSPTMAIIHTVNNSGSPYFKIPISSGPPILRTASGGGGYEPLHRDFAEEGRLSIENLDISCSYSSCTDMSAEAGHSIGGLTLDLDKSWRGLDDTSMGDSMLSDMHTAAKRMRIGDTSPLGIIMSHHRTPLMETPGPATRLFHQQLEDIARPMSPSSAGVATPRRTSETTDHDAQSHSSHEPEAHPMSSLEWSSTDQAPSVPKSQPPPTNRSYSQSPQVVRNTWSTVMSHASPQQNRQLRSMMTSRNAMLMSPQTTFRSFQEDFFGFHEIGHGSFGKVFKCVRKMDLQPYAVKEVVREFGSDRDRERMLKEIYALSAVRDNVHVVRYYSSWEEDGKLYIQTELCSGTLQQQCAHQGPLADSQLRTVTSHIATGLAFIHKTGMTHLDIKPENIYYKEAAGVYKLGDLGLASPATAASKADEGDKRYLSREMLQNESCDLKAADVFALGASLYEAASETPLPSSGDAYHEFREGRAAPLPPAVSRAMQGIINVMMHPTPPARPTAEQVAYHSELRGLLVHPEAPCLMASEAGGSPEATNLFKMATASGLNKMKSRAEIAEVQVLSLQAQLEETLAEVERYKELAHHTMRRGGGATAGDLHTIAPVGSSPHLQPIPCSPTMRSPSIQSPVGQSPFTMSSLDGPPMPDYNATPRLASDSVVELSHSEKRKNPLEPAALHASKLRRGALRGKPSGSGFTGRSMSDLDNSLCSMI